MTTKAIELIRTIEQCGGSIRVEDGNLKVAPRSLAAPIIDQLREHKLEIIAILRPEPEDYAADLRAPFAQWVGSSCAFGISFSGNLRLLLVDFCEWLAARRIALCPVDLFAQLTRELGCIVEQTPTGETLVLGLASRTGLEGFVQTGNTRNGSRKKEAR